MNRNNLRSKYPVLYKAASLEDGLEKSIYLIKPQLVKKLKEEVPLVNDDVSLDVDIIVNCFGRRATIEGVKIKNKDRAYFYYLYHMKVYWSI